MIGYVTLGTNDFKRAAPFYDAILGVIDAKRSMDMDEFILWSTGPGRPSLSIVKPYNGEAATVGNGTMVALTVKSKEQVHAIYDKAMELGSKDEGAPGPRGDSGFYAAYFRDLDGNKLCVFHMQR